MDPAFEVAASVRNAHRLAIGGLALGDRPEQAIERRLRGGAAEA